MLHLIKMWLTVPVEEKDEKTGKKRLTGGKEKDRGTPQGGVISPGLANLYMNRMLKGWRQTKRGEQFRARIVNYADDFVILSRGKAEEALGWTRGVMERLGADSQREEDEHQECAAGAIRLSGLYIRAALESADGAKVYRVCPSKKSVGKIKEKVGELLERGVVATLGRGTREAECRHCEAGSSTSTGGAPARRIGQWTHTWMSGCGTF